MVTRVGGLVSGMDTDTIVEDLMRLERQRRLDPITRDKEYNEWRTDAYQTVNETTANAIIDFKKALGITTTKSSSSYIGTESTNFDWLKTASSSNTDSLGVSASSNAIDGTYTLNVSQLAENVTRTSVAELPKITISSLEHQFGVENDFSIKLKTNDGSGDNVKTLNFTKDQTIEDVVAAINNDPDLGLEATYDIETDKFSIKTKDGYSNFEIQEDLESLLTTEKSKFKTNLVLNNEYATLDKTSSTAISPSNLTGQFGIVGDFSFTIKTNKTEESGYTFTFNEDTKLSEIIESINNADIGVVASYDSNLNRLFFATKTTGEDSYFEVTNDTANFLSAKKEVLSSSGDIQGTQGQSIMDRFGLVDGDFDAEGNTTIIIKSNEYPDGVGININKNDSIEDIANIVNSNNLGFEVNYDSATDTISLNNTGGAVTFVQDNLNLFASADGTGTKFNTDISIDEAIGENSKLNLNIESDTSYAGKNAIFDFNDAKGLERSTNNFEVYGINLKVKGTGTSTVTVGTDVDQAVEKIKEAIEKYNELVGVLTGLTSEKKYRDYQPLTDEEKEAMTEKQIELWEGKGKSGILRNDSIIDGMLNDMRSGFYDTVYEDYSTKTKLPGYSSIAEIGISTAELSTDGKLVIDDYKLRKALENDSSAVMKLLFATPENSELNRDDNQLTKEERATKYNEMGLFNRMYNSTVNGMKEVIAKAGPGEDTELLKNIKFNIMIDYVTVQSSESKLAKEKDQLTSAIKNQTKILQMIETRYWNQYSYMEQQINRMNSQYSSLFSNNSQS